MSSNYPDKFLLTIPEAIEYFNIGRDKLYSMAKKPGTDIFIRNGKKVLVKRKALEDYLMKSFYI